MTTETLDKLYLEWSQFTEARTARDLKYERALREVQARLGGDHPSLYDEPTGLLAEILAIIDAALGEQGKL